MDQEQVIAAYRLAAQEIAREQRPVTAGVVLTGLCAEAAARRRLGATDAATDIEALQELICGDVLATRAVTDLGVFTMLSVASWAGKVEGWISDRAEELLALQAMTAPVPLNPRELHIVTAAMESASGAGDATTAAVAYAGAVAVARLRIGAWEDSTPEERGAALAEVICGDPVWVAAEAELGEVRRRGAAGWVHGRWAGIEERAAVLMQLSAA